MASFDFKSPDSSGLHYLRDYHTFGRRDESVDTFLKYPYVSKLHAVIEWREPSWLLKDVSKNGIKLNNKVIPQQKPIALSVGDVIDFAGMNEVTVTINDLTPPTRMLINTKNPSQTIDLPDSSLLPDEENPELAVYLCPDRGQWYAESAAEGIEAGPYNHNDLIKIGDDEWKFLLVTEEDVTTEFVREQTTLDDVIFRFDLSQDEESTNLTLINGGIEVELGERSHHYLLVHLLRYRMNNESGWLDSQILMKELGLEEAHMNIQIFRARKQLRNSMPTSTGHSKFIERRRGALRSSIKNIEIYKEGVKEI